MMNKALCKAGTMWKNKVIIYMDWVLASKIRYFLRKAVYYSKEVDREECLLEMYGLLCSEKKSGLRKSLLLEKVKLSAKQELFIKRESELLGQNFGAFKGSLSRNMLIIKACGS